MSGRLTMRVTKEKSAENRDALLDAASRLFRERGIDGVGVAEIGKEAGLTHGALYAHFPSKDALVAEAFRKGFAGNMAGMRVWAGDRNPLLGEFLDALLSTTMRDSLASGCPMAASASEICRQGGAVSASFAESFEEMAAMIAGMMDEALPAEERRRRSAGILASQIGAIAVSRAVAKADSILADDILGSVRSLLGDALQTRGV